METEKRAGFVSRGRIGGAQSFQGSEKALCDTVTMNAHVYTLSKPIEGTRPRANLKVYCGVWVIMTCQCRFITYNKHYSGGAVGNTGGCTCYACACILF